MPWRYILGACPRMESLLQQIKQALNDKNIDSLKLHTHTLKEDLNRQ